MQNRLAGTSCRRLLALKAVSPVQAASKARPVMAAALKEVIPGVTALVLKGVRVVIRAVLRVVQGRRALVLKAVPKAVMVAGRVLSAATTAGRMAVPEVLLARKAVLAVPRAEGGATAWMRSLHNKRKCSRRSRKARRN